MDYPTVLIFPGLDGSDVLLRDFVAAAPSNASVRVLPLPDADSYSELAEKFDRFVRDAGPCVLIGESFSGPLAILLAERHQDLVKHLVLVAIDVRDRLQPDSTGIDQKLGTEPDQCFSAKAYHPLISDISHFSTPICVGLIRPSDEMQGMLA